jgi:hypothetical protein
MAVLVEATTIEDTQIKTHHCDRRSNWKKDVAFGTQQSENYETNKQ